MIEFMSYYTAEMLNQAQVYRNYRDHDGDSKLSEADLKLAIRLKQMTSFTKPISTMFV